MSTNTEQRDQIVTNAVREISHIATLPEITLRIVELVEDPESTAQDLHQVISNDPALSSRILKVVNSSFYGLPGQIGSINRAIVMLGLNAVKNIAIAASLAKLFRGGDLTPGFSARDLWKHSIAVAATTKMVADTLHVGLSDEAFLGGLIHDIGVMVEMQYDRNKLIEVIEQVGADADGVPMNTMIEIEETTFGADHQAFGAGLCDKWHFPKSLTLVTGYHHHPFDLPEEDRKLSVMVHMADRLAASLEGAFRLDLTSLEISEDVLDALKMTREQLTKVQEELPEHVESVEDLLT
jgi:putative nucleotidyltransferase with HDIG domain